MADQATAEATQAEAGAASQADDTSSGAATQAENGQDQDVISGDKYRKVQSEAKNLRQRLKEYEEKEAQTLPEKDRIERELKKLQIERDELHQEIRTTRVQSAAIKAGALYPDAVVKLVSPDAEDVEKAIKEVQRQYPALFSRGSADGGAGGDREAQPKDDMNQLIRRAAGRSN